MIRPFSILLIIVAACAGCQTHTPPSSRNDIKQDTLMSGKLITRLGLADKTFTKDSVMLSFTVVNNADTMQRFCKWETPFEPFLGKYMEIMDDHGNEALFKGAMARRVMPPPPESYIEVPPHDSIKTVFNIAKNYSITGGQYTIRYTGGGVSGLESGNEIKVTVTNL